MELKTTSKITTFRLVLASSIYPSILLGQQFALGSTTSSVKYTASITRACSHNDLLLRKQSVTTGVNIPNLRHVPYLKKKIPSYPCPTPQMLIIITSNNPSVISEKGTETPPRDLEWDVNNSSADCTTNRKKGKKIIHWKNKVKNTWCVFSDKRALIQMWNC